MKRKSQGKNGSKDSSIIETNSSRDVVPNPPNQSQSSHQQPLISPQIIGFFEAWIVLVEYMLFTITLSGFLTTIFPFYSLNNSYLGIDCVKEVSNETLIQDPTNFLKYRNEIFGGLSCIFKRDAGLILDAFIPLLIRVLILGFYFIWKYTRTTSFPIPKNLGLFTFNPFTLYFVFILFILLFDFILMIGIQIWTNRFIFSFANFFDKETGNLLYSRLFYIWFAVPFLEEIVFRGVLFLVLFQRFVSFNYSILISNGIFAAFHLFNFFGSSFATSYILFQLVMAILLGSFYLLQFLNSQTLWQPILLHFFNNFTSIFVSTSVELDFTNPLIFFPLIQTMIIYSFFVYDGLKKIKKLNLD